MGLITPESDLVGALHAGVNSNLGIITEDAHPHLPHRVWTDVWAQFGDGGKVTYRDLLGWCRDRHDGWHGWANIPIWTQWEAASQRYTGIIGTVWLFSSREIAVEFMLRWC